jgi:hypothetical protein
MNTETGKVYEGAEIDAARARGEKLASISHLAAERIREGRRLLAIDKRKMRLAARRVRERKTKKQSAALQRMQKASRKANRRR